MQARIYQPTKTAMQSGKANTRKWVLEYEPQTARSPEPLMGWVGSGDTLNQVRLTFDTREAAEAHAKRLGLAYDIIEPKTRPTKLRAYADNFRTDRVGAWTH